MTKEEIKNEIFVKIVCNEITEEEAISEYMKLGDSHETARIGYWSIKSDAVKAKLKSDAIKAKHDCDWL